jgi:tellurite resistance protein
MELLIFWGILLGIVFVAKLFKELDSDKSATSTSSRLNSAPAKSTKFRVRGSIDKKVIEETEFSVLNIGIRGAVSAPYGGFKTKVRVELFDETEEKLPILVMLEDLQAPGSLAFLYQEEGPTLPYAENFMTDWVDMFSFPLDLMVFPRSGIRKITILFYLLDSAGKRIVEKASSTVNVNFSEKGYLERQEERIRVRELTLRLAMAVSAVDGHLAGEESELIKKWVTEHVDLNDDEDDEERDSLNRAIKTAYRDLTEGEGIKISPLCEEINEKASTAEKYDALELCVELAGADSVAEKEEMAVLKEIAENLSIDQSKLRGFVDKHLPVMIHADQSVEDLIGLTPDMSAAEKKKVLRRAYRHWNGMVTHADSQKRQQAVEMLALIASERAKLNKVEEERV